MVFFMPKNLINSKYLKIPNSNLAHIVLKLGFGNFKLLEFPFLFIPFHLQPPLHPQKLIHWKRNLKFLIAKHK